MKTETLFSACNTYRYALWRSWDEVKPFVMIIGLNPSMTDDNPTITRCTNFARAWGFGGVCVANLFAYRAATPRELMAVGEPIGPDNDAWLRQCSEQSGLTVAAWGNYGSHRNRSSDARQLLNNLHCIRMNKSGEPAHPLYLKASLLPIKM